MLNLNNIFYGDCLRIMKEIDSNSIDMCITSPPYDNMRFYDGYKFDFISIANELYRIIKEGGVLVWIIGDTTIKGSETGTSFKHALYFKQIGFKLHDTMIWNKGGFTATGSLKVRYASVFEYMFILVKGKLKTFNPIMDRQTKNAGKIMHGTIKQKNNTFKKSYCEGKKVKDFSQRYNIWEIFPQKKRIKFKHPAPFPIELVRDHIISWSNEGDLILDPMCGSGTSCLAAKQLNRNYIGIDICEEYCKMARRRCNED